MTKKQKRDYYMAVIRNNLGWKVKDFRGMTFEEVEAKFNSVWKQMEYFITMGLKEEAERKKGKNCMHALVEWKLYDTCGVHHVTSKDKEIFMLVEKDYPLRKGLALVMISYKLQVENYLQMANDLILKIYKITNSPRQQGIPTASYKSSHWQNNFPLPMKKVATARRKVKPLPGRLHCYQKSRRNCQSKSNDSFTILVRSFDQQKNNIQAQQKKKMIKKSSSLENEPCCSKACKKNIDNLNSNITELAEKLNDKVNMIYHYSLGTRTHKEKKEKVDGKLEGFITASKDLDNLIESQRSDKKKEGLGYSVVPPPLAQIYSSPKKDLSWTGLPKFADDTITDYSRPSPAIESTSDDAQNKNPSVTDPSLSTPFNLISSRKGRKGTNLTDKLFDDKNMIYHYKLALAQVESRLVEYKEREVKYIEKIRTLEYYHESKKEYIETLKKELETLKQEKEVVDGKLSGLLTALKDLDNLIESQRSDKSKEGLGYTVVPPLPAQLYLSLKKDLSWTGLPECADDTVTDYSRPSSTVKSSSKEDQNRNPSVSENVASPITPKLFVKFVKASDSQSKSKIDEKGDT
nr:hypothetical protein [Tanacetum cinerariifolium]